MLLHWKDHTLAVIFVTGSMICFQPGGLVRKKVHVVLRDNASNMARAMKDAGLCSYRCFTHSLQVVVNDGVLSQHIVTDLLANCRSIAGHFR